MPETSQAQIKARQDWNGGSYTGSKRTQPKPLMITPVVEVCHTEGCGTPATGPAPLASMVTVRDSKDGAPAHWYCPTRCAPIARAHADLRTGGTR